MGLHLMKLYDLGCLKHQTGEFQLQLLHWGDGTTIAGSKFLVCCVAIDHDANIFTQDQCEKKNVFGMTPLVRFYATNFTPRSYSMKLAHPKYKLFLSPPQSLQDLTQEIRRDIVLSCVVFPRTASLRRHTSGDN